MAASGTKGSLLDRFRSLLGKLPFFPAAKARPGEFADFPFDEAEAGEEGGKGKARPKAPSLDVAAFLRSLLSSRLFLIVALGLSALLIAMLAAAIVVGLEPPPPPAAGAPITAEGRAAVSRLLLPPDPALSLEPPMERPPVFPYTVGDLERLAPIHDPRFLEELKARNDAAMAELFKAVK